MSVVVAAIIAGATAGITKVGGEIVSDLYKALKGKIAEVAQLDLSSIEEQPEDTHERMALEGEVKGAKLDTVAAVIEAANRVIDRKSVV